MRAVWQRSMVADGATDCKRNMYCIVCIASSLQGVFVVDWRVRHGAIQLMGQLQLCLFGSIRPHIFASACSFALLGEHSQACRSYQATTAPLPCAEK